MSDRIVKTIAQAWGDPTLVFETNSPAILTLEPDPQDDYSIVATCTLCNARIGFSGRALFRNLTGVVEMDLQFFSERGTPLKSQYFDHTTQNGRQALANDKLVHVCAAVPEDALERPALIVSMRNVHPSAEIIDRLVAERSTRVSPVSFRTRWLEVAGTLTGALGQNYFAAPDYFVSCLRCGRRNDFHFAEKFHELAESVKNSSFDGIATDGMYWIVDEPVICWDCSLKISVALTVKPVAETELRRRQHVEAIPGLRVVER